LKPAPDIVFVTYDDLKQGDPDDLSALKILSHRGLQCEVADWRNRDYPFTQSRLVVLRSTWNYHLHHSEFLQWVKTVAAHTNLQNSSGLIEWNSDKRYLRELSRRGLQIVPTLYIEGDTLAAVPLEQLLSALQEPDKPLSKRWVIKPSIGLSTFGVQKFDLSESGAEQKARDHIHMLAQNYCVMVQPFVAAVETYGERSLIFIAGRFSHAIRKTAFQHLAVAGEAGECQVKATRAEIDFGESVLALIPEQTLYARVDIVPDEQGQLLLLELELIEPSLYLKLGSGASERFADAVQACLG